MRREEPAALLGGGDGDRQGAGQTRGVARHLRNVQLGLVAAEVDRPGGGARHRYVVEVGQRLERGLDVRDERNGIGAVVWPSKVSVNVPPVAPATVIVWFSFVSWLLNGEKPPEFPPPDGVSSPVTSHRLLLESNSMSPPT